MQEQTPREIRQSRQPEIVNPLTLTLSETAQRGVLQSLQQSLRSSTDAQILGHFEGRPEMLAQIDETRNVTMQLAKNLREEIDPLTALNLGLTELIPQGQLEQWANTDPAIPTGNIRMVDIVKARYFLRNKPPEDKP